MNKNKLRMINLLVVYNIMKYKYFSQGLAN